MSDARPTQLTIYFIDFLGIRALEKDWARLRETAAKKLADLATEHRDNTLWGDTYTFPDPATAVQAYCTTVDSVKDGFQWSRTNEPLSVQFLLHGDDPHTPLGMDPRMWAFMLPEELYVTKTLWEQWKTFGKASTLPKHTAKDELLAAVRLSLNDRPNTANVSLFPARTAPLSGGGDECFYCGLRNHGPAECPSRNLRSDASGLALLGRMPLAQADRIYGEVFTGKKGKPATDLPDETGPDELRKNPKTQALAAFFDLRRIFQPRFLGTLFLGGADRWPETTVSRGSCNSSSAQICRGVQALLVHNYPDAEHLFSDVKGADPSTKFYGEVGLALIAVEKGQPKRVRYHLERAGKGANTDAETLYVAFLSSRLQEISGDLPGALRIMDEALGQNSACDDARYRREQLAVMAGHTDGSDQRLQLVASRKPECAVALLLDPWLEPIRAGLDRKLLNLILTAHQGGKGKLAQVVNQGADLADWLGEHDTDVAPVISGLRKLGGKVTRAGYYDMLELERAADKLSSACDNTRRSRRGTLKAQVESVEKLWEPLAAFWNDFNLKHMYQQLGDRFRQVQEDLGRAGELASSDDVSGYREAVELLESVRQSIKELSARTREIGAVPLIYGFVRRFLAYLVMMESLALMVGLAILPLFRLVLSMDRGSQASAAGGNSVLYTLTFAVAPVLALVLTGMKQKKVAKATAGTNS